MYLQLSQCETTAGTNAAVVLDGSASHDRSELVDGAGSQGSGLGLAGVPSRDLLAGLYFNSHVRSSSLTHMYHSFSVILLNDALLFLMQFLVANSRWG